MSVLKSKSVLEAAVDFLDYINRVNPDRSDITVGIDLEFIIVNADTDIFCPTIYDGYPVKKIIVEIPKVIGNIVVGSVKVELKND